MSRRRDHDDMESGAFAVADLVKVPIVAGDRFRCQVCLEDVVAEGPLEQVPKHCGRWALPVNGEDAR